MIPILWADVETSGLDVQSCMLLEVSMVLTDENLSMMASLTKQVRIDEGEFILTAPARVIEMHNDSGLLADCRERGISQKNLDDLFSDWIERNSAEDLPMGGSNPCFDRMVMRRLMPNSERLFHYRSFDVNSICYFFGVKKETYTSSYMKRKHRAYEDLRQDIILTRKLVREYLRLGEKHE